MGFFPSFQMSHDLGIGFQCEGSCKALHPYTHKFKDSGRK